MPRLICKFPSILDYPGAQSLDEITLYRCQSDGSVEKVHECYIGCIGGGDDNDGKCIAEIP